MRIATWNINSVRLRLPLLEQFIALAKPDVLCLQETKCPDEAFPTAALAQAGYPHQHIAGMKSYNGVAILARQPLTATGVLNWQQREDCRHIHATLANGWEIHNVYVPAGGDIPDPHANPKFAHKLGFVDEQATWWRQQPENTPRILVGDLNIAPLEHDVWSHRQMQGVVSHTPEEISRLEKMQQAHGWIDALRRFVPPEDKLYTWWSYRAADWEQSNRGRRLDHIWVTPQLGDGLQRMQVWREARGWEPKPSDHVPVTVDIADVAK
jgi:exodeoxyribonuclease III